MKAVFLDTDMMGEEVSYDGLKKLPLEWLFFKATTPAEIGERVRDAEIVVSNKVLLTQDLLKKCPKLKLICIAATGYNNVDLQTAYQLQIPVCNIPGYGTASVAQLTLAFILALATHLIPYIQDVKAGKWQKYPQCSMLTHPIFELEGKKLGIIGYGTLGEKVGTLAQAFGMELLIAQHTDSKKPSRGGCTFEQLLKESDFLTIHTPLTPQTRNLIQRKEIEQMKSSAFLINTARGGIVNEKDLAACLKERRIAGAGVDVLSHEPPQEDAPLLDPDIPNLLLTPHIAWGSIESRERLLDILKDNIQAFLDGSPRNVVT